MGEQGLLRCRVDEKKASRMLRNEGGCSQIEGPGCDSSSCEGKTEMVEGGLRGPKLRFLSPASSSGRFGRVSSSDTRHEIRSIGHGSA